MRNTDRQSNLADAGFKKISCKEKNRKKLGAFTDRRQTGIDQAFLTDYACASRLKDYRKSALKVLSVIFIAILSLSQTLAYADHLVISAVYPDPITTESGGEAVELFNPTENAIDLSGYILQTQQYATDATLPNIILPKHTYFLVADTGFSLQKDNLSWVGADYEETISIANSNSGVILRSPNGILVDSVGWGIPNSEFFETQPTLQPSEGQMIRRQDPFSDSANNSLDFSITAPIFFNRNTTITQIAGTGQSPSAHELTVSLTVENNQPFIQNLTIQSSQLTGPGVQINLIPGNVSELNLSIIVSDEDGVDTLGNMTVIMGNISMQIGNKTILSQTSAVYSGRLQIPYYFRAGNVTLRVLVEDDSQQQVFSEKQLTIGSLTGFSLNSSRINFVRQGNSSNQSAKIKISNSGNTVLDFRIAGSDLTGKNKTVSVSTMSYSFLQTNQTLVQNNMSFDSRSMDLRLNPGEAKDISVNFFTQERISAGNYSGTLYFSGDEVLD